MTFDLKKLLLEMIDGNIAGSINQRIRTVLFVEFEQ